MHQAATEMHAAVLKIQTMAAHSRVWAIVVNTVIAMYTLSASVCILLHHLPLLAACDLHSRFVQLVAGRQRLNADHARNLRRLAWWAVRHSSGDISGTGRCVYELVTTLDAKHVPHLQQRLAEQVCCRLYRWRLRLLLLCFFLFLLPAASRCSGSCWCRWPIGRLGCFICCRGVCAGLAVCSTQRNYHENSHKPTSKCDHATAPLVACGRDH